MFNDSRSLKRHCNINGHELYPQLSYRDCHNQSKEIAFHVKSPLTTGDQLGRHSIYRTDLATMEEGSGMVRWSTVLTVECTGQYLDI